uniref:Uncharacterized protein n=1 Tax=Anopheles gambiae TaxID=7165 RepID=A0A2C9H3T0_ANOGA
MIYPCKFQSYRCTRMLIDGCRRKDGVRF